MFTGLIERVGAVLRVEPGTASSRLVIKAGDLVKGLRTGDSVAVDGVCLTATGVQQDDFSADVMAETLDRTTLGELRAGSRVNLERALALGDRLGGHLVTGHVDGVGRILRWEERGIAMEMVVSAPADLMPYIVVKGSVAVDGISLTVMERGPETFRVGVIPHTREKTTLGVKGRGATVNLEVDIIARYLRGLLDEYKAGGGLQESLLRAGFIGGARQLD